jgi:hypothetical protein
MKETSLKNPFVVIPLYPIVISGLPEIELPIPCQPFQPLPVEF